MSKDQKVFELVSTKEIQCMYISSCDRSLLRHVQRHLSHWVSLVGVVQPKWKCDHSITKHQVSRHSILQSTSL